MGKEGERCCVGSEQSAGAPRWNNRGAAAFAGLREKRKGEGVVMMKGVLCVCVRVCVPAVDGVLWACVQLQDNRRSEATRGSALVSSADPARVALTRAALRQLTRC